jgi:hypothetical protein
VASTFTPQAVRQLRLMPPRARLALVQVSLHTGLGAFLDLEDVAFSVTQIASATANLKVLFDLKLEVRIKPEIRAAADTDLPDTALDVGEQ